MKTLFFLFGLALIPFHSCTTSYKMSDNQKSSGHFRLYSFPEKRNTKKEKFDESRFKKLVIVSSNDFKGHIFPEIHPIPNRFNERRYMRIGGVASMRAYLDIFRKEFADHMLYFDAGSFLDLEKNHAQTFFLYQYLGVDVSALGLNEFILNTPPRKQPVEYLASLTKNISYDLVNSNLFDLTQAEQIQIPGSKDTVIKEINGLKVGVIGVLTRSLSKKIPDQKINGLYIQNPVKNVISKATQLRRRGANVIVLLANEGVDCTSRMAHSLGLSEDKVNFEPMNSTHCDKYKSDFVNLLEGLPQNTVDLAVTSGGNSKVANFIHGVPVIQNKGDGKYLSWAELYFDTKHQIVVNQMTKLHQPVMLCEEFFKETQDCFIEGSIENRELTDAMFLGKKIKVKDLPKSMPRLE